MNGKGKEYNDNGVLIFEGNLSTDLQEYKNELKNAKIKIGGEMYRRFMQGFNKGKK